MDIFIITDQKLLHKKTVSVYTATEQQTAGRFSPTLANFGH